MPRVIVTRKESGAIAKQVFLYFVLVLDLSKTSLWRGSSFHFRSRLGVFVDASTRTLGYRGVNVSGMRIEHAIILSCF